MNLWECLLCAERDLVVDFLEFQSFYGVLLAHNSLYDEGNRFAYVVIGDFSGYYVVRMTICRIAPALHYHIQPFRWNTAEFHQPEIDPEQAEIIRLIFDRYLEGDSLQAIKDLLESKGYLSPTRKTTWSVATIRSILTNKWNRNASKKHFKNTSDVFLLLKETRHEAFITCLRKRSHQIRRSLMLMKIHIADLKKASISVRI